MLRFEESFPSPKDEKTTDLLYEMSMLCETYSRHTLTQRIRYTTMVAKWLHALRQVPGYRAQGAQPPCFGRRQMRCDGMWCELLFSAVDTGLMFLETQTQIEKETKCELMSSEQRQEAHCQARKVIGLLNYTYNVVSSGWKGLRPDFFRNLGEPRYDLSQLKALQLWVQAYGLWNRGFLSIMNGDMEPEPIFRTCAKILGSHEAQQLSDWSSICAIPLSTGNYTPLLTAPAESKPKFRPMWYNFARTEWVTAAANDADDADDLPRLLSLVRLLYINDRPGCATRLVQLENRARGIQKPIPDALSTLRWLSDRYPPLEESRSMSTGDDPLRELPEKVFTYRLN